MTAPFFNRSSSIFMAGALMAMGLAFSPATATAMQAPPPFTGTAHAHPYILRVADRSSDRAAENFIKSMAQRALDFLGNTQQTQAQKEESFRRLLEDNYDLETIGRFTLGRYWRVATQQQKTDFQNLFRRYVVALYSKRFSEYKGQKFEVTGSRADGKDTIVLSDIVPADGGPNVSVNWRVRNIGGRDRVVDVVVAGVSMSMTQRSDFASVIQQGGGNVQALLNSLKQKI